MVFIGFNLLICTLSCQRSANELNIGYVLGLVLVIFAFNVNTLGTNAPTFNPALNM